MTPGPSLDERLFRLGDAMRRGRLDAWEFDFAKSILGQSKRPRWTPSQRQRAIIDKLIAKPVRTASTLAGAESLIDDEDAA